MKKKIIRNLKSRDSMLSMVIGVAVILAIGYAIISNIKSTSIKKQEELKKIEEQKNAGMIKLPAQHTVKEGENLWIISETYYKSGYNWVDIRDENKLENPDYITVDKQLTIPDVKPRIPEGDISPLAATTSAPKHSTYTVVEGDTLWDISLKEYETNYRWPDISSANKLPNPDLIYPETILQLPR